jgi:predicted secreted protein
MKAKVIFPIFFLLLLTMTFCFKNDQNVIEGKVNSFLKIDLISNPSTGYEWIWTNKQEITIVDSIGYSFVPYQSYPGSSGIETWTFLGIRPGTEVLEFKYCHPWEQNSTIDQKAVTIIVN